MNSNTGEKKWSFEVSEHPDDNGITYLKFNGVIVGELWKDNGKVTSQQICYAMNNSEKLKEENERLKNDWEGILSNNKELTMQLSTISQSHERLYEVLERINHFKAQEPIDWGIVSLALATASSLLKKDEKK